MSLKIHPQTSKISLPPAITKCSLAVCLSPMLHRVPAVFYFIAAYFQNLYFKFCIMTFILYFLHLYSPLLHSQQSLSLQDQEWIAGPLKMGPICCPTTMVINSQPMLYNITEEQIPPLQHSRSLKSRHFQRFPQLVYFKNTFTQANLPKVCLIFVITFPQHTYLAT